MGIPKTNFGLYIVMSRHELVMGVYQTFGQALDRVCELLKTSQLTEKVCDKTHIRYYSEADQERYYDVYHSHFFYDLELPLVDDPLSSFTKENQRFEPVIVNK